MTGWQNKKTGAEIGLDRMQVALWRRRLLECSVDALVERKTPERLPLHLVVDDYAIHSHPVVQLAGQHPRFVMHFTLTGASWLDRVERFFRDLIEAHPARQLQAWST